MIRLEKEKRQQAYNFLLQLAEQQGYITFDNIMDQADAFSLPIQDFDWLSNSLIGKGILVYNEAPENLVSDTNDDDDYYDYAQIDYAKIYRRIVQLNPALEQLVRTVEQILPPQNRETNKLKYQVVDGNAFARKRLIEMHLRMALRIALQRAEAYDLDIEEVISNAFVGLVIAVDKFNPDINGPFSQYASWWILQNISREQETKRPLVYYPVHRKEGYFTMYLSLKKHSCIECDNILKCKKVKSIIMKRLGCSESVAVDIINQMLPLEYIDGIVDSLDNEQDFEENLTKTFIDGVVSEEIEYEKIFNSMCAEEIKKVLETLKPREQETIKLRFGLSGGEPLTLEEIGNIFGVTRERIRQIEAKAIRKLKHPSRSKKLKEYY